jgi:hypothetical protein
MGFHAVATGFVLKKGYIDVVFKSIKDKKNDKVYEGEKLHEYFADFCEENDICDLYQIFELEDYEFVLHSDILFLKEKCRVVYAKNPKIIIGCPMCCDEMIYISCVGDDIGGGDDEEFEDQDILDFLEWKNILVQQGRMENAKFSCIGNCCS